MQDLRFAIRMLASRPVFTAAAVLSLGLGIGANSVIFSIVDGLMLRPLAVPGASRVVRIFSSTNQNQEGLLSFPEYLDLRAQSTTLTGVVAIGGRGGFLNYNGSRQLTSLYLVSSNFFDDLHVRPESGRFFGPSDTTPVVVLGNAAWHRLFGGDPAIVGKQIRFERETNTLYTVIGILPARFRDIDAGSDRDFWFPEQCWKWLGNPAELTTRNGRWFRALGRLAPGKSIDQAKTELAGISVRLAQAFPESNQDLRFTAQLDSAYKLRQAGDQGLAVLAIVLLVVLVSGVNVANLLLSRADERGREMAVRLSLGASRLRVIRQLLIESFLIGSLGLAVGLTAAWWLIEWLPALMVPAPGFDIPSDFALDLRVFLFSTTVAAVTTILFGVVPALRFSRQPDLVSALKSGSLLASSTTRHAGIWPFRNWLVASETGIALVLRVCSGMLVRSYWNTQAGDLGFGRTPTLLVWLSASGAKPAQYREIASHYAAMAGVREVAIAVRAPLSLSNNGMVQPVTFPGLPQSEIKYNSVTPNFFSAMQTPILQGRGFDSREEAATSDSVVINESLAHRYFAQVDPTGRILIVGGKPRTIIGVAKNTPINSIGEPPEPYLYLPYWSNFEEEATFLITTQGDASALAQPARQILKRLDPTLDPSGITTMKDLIRYSAARYQLSAELVSALGILGLLLTAVGLYGVVSYGISQRSRELGIRMALGASANLTRRLVLGEVARLGLTGIAIGFPLALAATRGLAALLFGIEPWHGPTFIEAAALLFTVILFAGWIPTRRATRIDPASVLRSV